LFPVNHHRKIKLGLWKISGLLKKYLHNAKERLEQTTPGVRNAGFLGWIFKAPSDMTGKFSEL